MILIVGQGDQLPELSMSNVIDAWGHNIHVVVKYIQSYPKFSLFHLSGEVIAMGIYAWYGAESSDDVHGGLSGI